VMVGRGALGNPWIFRQIKYYMETGESLPEPTIEERIEVARDHLRRIVSLHGEDKGVKEMRGQLAWYIKGVKGASHIRGILAEASTLSEMESALMEILLHGHQE
ncbi:MAG: tRNA-dihydrouridine synthase, partial [Armatimonadota bacterium]